MIKCRRCGSNCDAADIRNWLCDDCREAEAEKNIKTIHPAVAVRIVPDKNQRAG